MIPTAFLDTVGMLAIWDDHDQWHAAASAAYGDLLRRRVRLVTTTLVLYKLGNAAARRPYRHRVVELREFLGGRGCLYEPSIDELQDAWADYARHLAASAGIVDHTSFAVMRRLGVADAFTNDRHFAAAGFNPLF